MELGLLRDFFENFSTRGERYYFGVEGACDENGHARWEWPREVTFVWWRGQLDTQCKVNVRWEWPRKVRMVTHKVTSAGRRGHLDTQCKVNTRWEWPCEVNMRWEWPREVNMRWEWPREVRMVTHKVTSAWWRRQLDTQREVDTSWEWPCKVRFAKSHRIHARQICQFVSMQNGKVVSHGCAVTLGRCYLGNVLRSKDVGFESGRSTHLVTHWPTIMNLTVTSEAAFILYSSNQGVSEVHNPLWLATIRRKWLSWHTHHSAT